jgi:hypothetical protein
MMFLSLVVFFVSLSKAGVPLKDRTATISVGRYPVCDPSRHREDRHFPWRRIESRARLGLCLQQR